MCEPTFGILGHITVASKHSFILQSIDILPVLPFLYRTLCHIVTTASAGAVGHTLPNTRESISIARWTINSFSFFILCNTQSLILSSLYLSLTSSSLISTSMAILAADPASNPMRTGFPDWATNMYNSPREHLKVQGMNGHLLLFSFSLVLRSISEEMH